MKIFKCILIIPYKVICCIIRLYQYLRRKMGLSCFPKPKHDSEEFEQESKEDESNLPEIKKWKGEPKKTHLFVESRKGCFKVEKANKFSKYLEVYVDQGDIAKIGYVDAIVNVFDKEFKELNEQTFAHGVTGAIMKSAGRRMLNQLQSYRRMHVRDTVVTDAYGLNEDKTCTYVIHVVSPGWFEDDKRRTYEQDKEVESSLQYCLKAADNKQFTSLSMPLAGPGFTAGEIQASAIVDYIARNPQSHISKIHIVGRTGDDDFLYHILQHLKTAAKIVKPATDDAVPTFTSRKRHNELASFSLDSARTSDEYPTYVPSASSAHGDMGLYGSSAPSSSRGYVPAHGSDDDMPRHDESFSPIKVMRGRKRHQPKDSLDDQFSPVDRSSVGSRNRPHTLGKRDLNRDHSPLDNADVSIPIGGAAASPELLQSHKGDNKTCAICLDDFDPTTKTLDKCKHKFCKDCIEQAFKAKPVCPTCGELYGQLTGSQPDGNMNIRREYNTQLPGYEDFGSIVIEYSFRDGVQGDNHPNPGVRYRGIRRTAYLPDNPEGNYVLSLLRKAWDARLIFTIGRSTTTGKDNQITWNDIHHKTNIHGGPQRFGYPDHGYLDRIKDELAAKGIK